MRKTIQTVVNLMGSLLGWWWLAVVMWTQLWRLERVCLDVRVWWEEGWSSFVHTLHNHSSKMSMRILGKYGNVTGCHGEFTFWVLVCRVMALQRCPCPSPWNLWIHYLIWQKGLGRCDEIRVLRWGDDPGGP